MPDIERRYSSEYREVTSPYVSRDRARSANANELPRIPCPNCCRMTPSIGRYCGYCGKRLSNKAKRDVDETKQQRENLTNDKALIYDVKGILSFITMLIGVILVILSFCINEYYFLFIPGVLVAIVGFLWWISEIAKVKCPKCNSKNVFQISNVKTGEDYSTRTKKVEEKVYTNYDNSFRHHAIPTYTIEKDVSVPVTVHHYKVKYKCNDCGYVFTRNEDAITED